MSGEEQNKADLKVQRPNSPRPPWQFQPGKSGNPAGRPAGTRNQLTKQLVLDILEAYNRRGGVDGLTKLDPRLFTSLIREILPKAHEIDADVQVEFADILAELSRRVRPKQAPAAENGRKPL